MRRPKSALPLPAYTRRKWLKSGWAYYFEPPTWARNLANDDPRGPCPVDAEELGGDYAAAVARAENVLLPAFHTWRTRGAFDPSPRTDAVGTLDWLFGQYRATDKFRRLSKRMRKLHEDGFKLVGQYVLKDGRALGAIKLASIDTGVVDPLYEKLVYQRDDNGEKIPLIDPDTGKQARDAAGEPLWCERRTTVNHAMKSCRRAWNVVLRLHPRDVPALNPFAKMGLQGTDGVVTEATYDELIAAVTAADELGMPSLGTALMVTWEWLQREEHIFTAFLLDHYRPKARPNDVRIVHPKNGESVWYPLFDRKGKPLFPELMARLDAMRQNRVGGLMFMRDWADRRAKVPVPWVSPSGDLTFVRNCTRELIDKAELRDELTFTSFRHGGMTELGDAELSDAQIRALSRHKSSKIVQRYVKSTQRQIISGTHRRRAVRRQPKG